MRLKNKISSLIEILKETDIDEIEVSSLWGAQKIRVSNKKVYQVENKLNTSIREESVNEHSQEIKIEKNEISAEDTPIINESSLSVKAPLVGTFYSSPSPESPPFIKIGDKIKKGQTICIIEAMKIFNEIESEYEGTVSEILIENGTPVEFDQDLIKLK
ncbi:MAG: acetyl-CoA carboxylase, biotin carboxyl carrier protein [Candidatus Marinimicrobia bacterium]|nr:acetyl-CoA carboxylase, biotin carboxyl carrier protein [Candidatus Neomarinimicrobiota bacterium]